MMIITQQQIFLKVIRKPKLIIFNNLLTKSIFDYLLLQIVFMVKMNGAFMQTLLKNIGLQLITKFIAWYSIFITGMSILKVGIPPV